MSEQYFQRPEDEHENSHIDDPLAELARIVTSEETRAESTSTHHKSRGSEKQYFGQQSKDSGQPKQSALSASQPADTGNEENPFAKFVVKPVDIPEKPRKTPEDRTLSAAVSEQSERDRASIFSEESPQEEFDTPANEDGVDPFADIDLKFTDLLETGLAEEEANYIVEDAVDGDGLDLESQLMAELNGEAESYVPQYVDSSPSDNLDVAEEQSSQQLEENIAESPTPELSNSEERQQFDDAVEDPETEEFLEAFAAGRIQVTQQDIEASIKQKIGISDEQLDNSHQQSTEVPHRNSGMQNEIDAVLSSLERPINVAQNDRPIPDSDFDAQKFRTAFDAGNGVLPEHSGVSSAESPNDASISNSPMDQMSSALAGSIKTQTELGEFAELGDFVTELQNQESEQQHADPHLFYQEQDYSNDERRINDSVHALQDDLAAQSMEIESAFSDAFAEELSLDLGSQNADNLNPQSQMEFEHQHSGHQTDQDQDYQNYPPDNGYPDEYFDGYSDQYYDDDHAMSHDGSFGATGVETANYDKKATQPESAVERDETKIDQALAGALIPQRNKSSGFKMAAIALGCAVIIGAGVVGYGLIGETINNNDPVLVRADQSDFKVKPDQPGGREIANQDQPVYVRMNGKKTTLESQERLVSSNIKPVDLENSKESANQSKSSERLSSNKAKSNENAADTFVQPRKVKTVIVRADGTIITSEGTKVADLGAVPAAKLAPVQVHGDQGKPVDGAKSTDIIPVPAANPFITTKSGTAVSANALKGASATQNLVAEQKDEAQVAKTMRVPVQQVTAIAADAPVNNTVVATTGTYKVQISSQRSQEAAEATYQNLKQKFASLLDGQPKEIRAVDVDGKGTFYRVQIPVGGMPEAASFCKRYKAAGGSCFVTR
ncbi:MAG: hypothetical protein GY761_21850 [Hyphomicrobiales bacterium]|nr:hypothetical protein [Hyphomicrobiales bacterium]